MPGEVTQLLIGIQNGDESAKNKLIEMVYLELKRIAANQQPRGILGVTDVTHDAVANFLRMPFFAEDRRHFFAVMKKTMAHIIINRWREKPRLERERIRVPLDDVLDILPDGVEPPDIDLQECLKKLQEADERAYQVVWLRYFMQYSNQEIADQLDLGPSSIEKDLQFAKAFLRKCLGERSNAR